MKNRIFKVHYNRHGEDTWVVEIGIRNSKTIITRHVMISCPVHTVILNGKAYITGHGEILESSKECVRIY